MWKNKIDVLSKFLWKKSLTEPPAEKCSLLQPSSICSGGGLCLSDLHHEEKLSFLEQRSENMASFILSEEFYNESAFRVTLRSV